MLQTVLIAGGSGLIGEALSAELIKQGFAVRLLGRGNKSIREVQHFFWDPEQQKIDPAALIGVDVVINLAGANVGKGKWTPARKKILLNSRINSTQLLSKTIIENKLPIKKFIQASAIGYYGFDAEKPCIETDPPGKDFLAKLTYEWENSTIEIKQNNISLNLLRIGVVLSPKGGALIEMSKPIKYFLGAPLGSGKQMVPWIHMDDMVQILLKCIQENEFIGTYNCVSPNPVTNKQLTKQIAKCIGRPVWPIPIPSFILKMLLGEQAQIVLEGYTISSHKLETTGFRFKYSTIQFAIESSFK